jgi:hypothetical protein
VPLVGRMRSAVKIIEVVLLSWFLDLHSSEVVAEEMPTNSSPDTPYIFEGVVVSVPKIRSGVSALQTRLPSLPRNFAAEPLGVNTTFLVNDKGALRMASQSALKLKPLSRKSNRCKSAKFRRAFSREKVGVYVRCEPNLV